ncbi:MAG: hypothetical protein LH477_08510 [Nocardioides sp.]|nr:hypothetical protein [Nocardioides sp.]
MNLPTDFPHEIAQRADQPGFDEVLDRARSARHRRRTTIASGLATVCVVGGIVAATQLGPRTPVEPASAPTPTSLTGEVDDRVPTDVRELLADERTVLALVSGSGEATAAVWASCSATAGTCRSALVTTEGDKVEGRILEDGSGIVQPVPGGWLVPSPRNAVRVTPDGGTDEVYDVGGGPVPAEAGDTAVWTTTDIRLLRGDKLVPMLAPEGAEVTGAYVAPDGQLVVTASGPGGRRHLATVQPGQSWSWSVVSDAALEDSAGTPPVLEGRGDSVVLAQLGDDPDRSVPLISLRVSHDGGLTWSPVTGLDLTGTDGVRNLSSLVVSPEGTIFLTTESHGLVRIDRDGTVATSRFSTYDTSAFVVSDSVCVVTEAGRVDDLRCSTDDGGTWATTPLPGFR